MIFQKGHIGYWKGKKHLEETKKKISIRHKGKHFSLANEFKKGRHPSLATEFKKGQKGKNHPYWKGGISRIEGYYKQKLKEWRHKLGINKRYNSELSISHTKEYKKLQRQKRKAVVRNGGELTIQTIQIVYENNIKKYGTLTCYLCLNPIPFGKDHLEHKIPLSRSGTNFKENLDVACQRCNLKKNTKTEAEFKKEVLLWKT